MSYTSIYNDKHQNGKNEVIEFLKSYQLEQYSDAFIEEGFDTMNAVKEIREDDLEALNVKRGHRRLIQRALAIFCGMSTQVVNTYQPVPFYSRNVLPRKDMGGETSSGYGSQQSSSSFFSSITEPNTIPEAEGDQNDKTSFDEEDEENSDHSMKNTYTRKYKRHPKPDTHAPIKPLSAYVMFSNTARAKLKKHNLSFAEIAKIVGEQWKNLDPQEKRSYERNAMQSKDEYVEALDKYKKTEKYKEYQAYLADFKSKQQQENKRIMRERKKAKRNSSTSSSGNMADYSSNDSIGSNNYSNSVASMHSYNKTAKGLT
ncbi:unnamed protein product [Rhizopus stolonifer]